MKAEIISVGDELTSGQRLDTNSQFISRRLGDLGIDVRHHTTVGDDLADNVAAFRIAAGRSDVVIISGGLGPTADDLTREAMAQAFDRPLEFRPEAMQHIESLFKTRNRPMPERNRVQAMFPETSRIIHNPHGTAPGIDLEVRLESSEGGHDHSSRLFALPGVPAEMIEMLSQTVEPRLIAELGLGQNRWYYHSLKLFGLGESDVEKVIPDLIARDRTPRVGITVSKATITLRIAAQAASQQDFDAQILGTIEQIREAFGEFIFAQGDLELQDVVRELLDQKGCTLSVVEIGAGCWVGQMLSDGFDTQANGGLKHLTWLPTRPESTDPDWLVNLASRSQQSFKTDYALAVGTYPAISDFESQTSLPWADLQVAIVGPLDQAEDKADDQGDRRKVVTKSQRVSGHPELFYQRLAKTALDMLRREIIGE